MFRLPSSFSASRSHWWFRGIFLTAITQISFAAAPSLSSTTSAYLQSLADSPIAWHAWGDAAFAEAKQHGKPIFLSMGNATSELSRAMQRQSFSNADTAAFLNENFVCIAVDAKEQPDVFALYQNYVQAVKQMSGPPLNIWLTPELKPFEGANYLPPTEEWGKEGFITTVKRVAAAWKNDPEAQRRKAEEATTAVTAAQETAAPAPVTAAEIATLRSAAAESVRTRFDATNGGFGEPPKYPDPELLRFLLRDAATREMALVTLRKIIDSPVHDPLDGGFFRYAVDAGWHQPYFQKLLGDQARLALAFLEAAELSGDARYAQAARSALQFALQTMRNPDGEYVSVLDATSEENIAAQLWTLAEIREALGEERAREFSSAYGVTAEGNVAEDAYPGLTTKGKNLLSRIAPRGSDEAEKKLENDCAKLRQQRQKRIAPRRDEGAISGVHGLMLAALARAGAQLSDATFTSAARSEAVFIQKQLREGDGGLLRLAGHAFAAAPLDYALVIDGLFRFANITGDKEAERFAQTLLTALNQRFHDPKSDRYFAIAANAGPAFWARVRAPAATPGELVSVEVALLNALKSQKAANKAAESLQACIAADVKANPETASGELLMGLSTTP